MGDSQRSQTISTDSREIASQTAMKSKGNTKERIAEPLPILVPESSLVHIRTMAKQDLQMTFTSLVHKVDLFLLNKSFRQLCKNSATGVDKVTVDKGPPRVE